jgi:RimJ/RimL family protein N-acetyltransferase
MENRLRPATLEDMYLIYEWANEEDTRKNSFHTEKITYTEHQTWFRAKMESPQCDIFIYENNTLPTGLLRLEYKEEKAFISFSTDKLYRGQGHGRRILELASDYIKEQHPCIMYLYGLVKYSNIASQRTFEGLNYTRENLPDYIEYHKSIRAE